MDSPNLRQARLKTKYLASKLLKCDCSPIVTTCIFSLVFGVFLVQRIKLISKQQIIYHITVTLGGQDLAGASSENTEYKNGPQDVHPSLASDSKTGFQKSDTVMYTYLG